MGNYVKLSLVKNYTGPKVLYYRRYVEGIICYLKNNSNDARLIFEYLYTCHSNIKFTMETKEIKKKEINSSDFLNSFGTSQSHYFKMAIFQYSYTKIIKTFTPLRKGGKNTIIQLYANSTPRPWFHFFIYTNDLLALSVLWMLWGKTLIYFVLCCVRWGVTCE